MVSLLTLDDLSVSSRNGERSADSSRCLQTTVESGPRGLNGRHRGQGSGSAPTPVVSSLEQQGPCGYRIDDGDGMLL